MILVSRSQREQKAKYFKEHLISLVKTFFRLLLKVAWENSVPTKFRIFRIFFYVRQFYCRFWMLFFALLFWRFNYI